MRRDALALSLAALFLVGPLDAGAAGADPWKDYRFLLGSWSGAGKGAPGQGEGQFSFALDLQGKVMVRKHRAEIRAARGRPASVHEDLLVIYREDAGKPPRAIYFDSEGHVVHYALSFSPDKQRLIFVSDAPAGGPRFRLTYAKRKGGKLAIRFKIAPPGKPDAFRTYLEGTAVRTAPKTTDRQGQK
jgi:hypothetical protein